MKNQRRCQEPLPMSDAVTRRMVIAAFQFLPEQAAMALCGARHGARFRELWTASSLPGAEL